MKLILLMVYCTLLSSTLCQVHSTVNEEFPWFDYTIKNQIADGFIVLQSPNSYQRISINSTMLQISSDKRDSPNRSSSALSGAPYIRKTNKFRIRADSGIQQQSSINNSLSTCTSSTALSVQLRVVFSRGSNQTLSFSIVHTNCQKPCTGTFDRNITIDEYNYSLYNDSTTSRCFLQISKPDNLTFNGTLKIQSFTGILISNSFLKVTDYQEYFQHEFQLYQISSISFTTTYTQSGVHVTDDVSLPLNGMTMFNRQYKRLVNTDYANITLLPNQNNVQGVLIGFRYFIGQPDLNAYIFAAIGNFNGVWATPPNYNNLPAIIAKNWSIVASFSYSVTEQFYAASTTATCLVVQLSSNYNRYSKSFVSKNQEIEIAVCAERNRVQPYDSKTNFSIAGKTYSLFKETTVWSSYTFTDPFSNSRQINNLDLYPFIHAIRREYNLSSDFYISSVQAGFRLYKGYGIYRFNNASFTVKENKFYTVCLLPASNNCQEQTQRFKELILIVASTPCLILLLRANVMFNSLDELAYFSDHTSQYDYYFTALSQLSWNIMNQKWVPSYFQPAYKQFTAKYLTVTLLNEDKVRNPGRFQKNDDNLVFFNNTREFWLVYLPMTVLVFVLVNILVRLFKHPRVVYFLRPFASFASLFVFVLGSHIQHLTFRATQQFLFWAPTQSTVSVFNLILAATVLFFLVFGALSLFLLIRSSDLPLFRLHLMKKTLKSHIFLTMMLVFRLIAGIGHACFENSAIQISSLFLMCVATMILIIVCRKSFRNRFDTVCIFLQQLIQAVLYIILVLQAYRPRIYIDFDHVNAVLSSFTQYTVMVGFVLIALQIVFNWIHGLLELLFSKETGEDHPLNNQSTVIFSKNYRNKNTKTKDLCEEMGEEEVAAPKKMIAIKVHRMLKKTARIAPIDPSDDQPVESHIKINSFTGKLQADPEKNNYSQFKVTLQDIKNLRNIV